MNLPKNISNYMRLRLKNEISYVEEHIIKLERDIEILEYKSRIMLIDSKVRKDKDEVNNNIKMNDTLIETLKSYVEHYKLDLKKIEIFKNAIKKDGINEVIYSLPKMILQHDIDDLSYQWLIIDAIRFNGTHEKKLVNLYDELEIKIHDYEKKLAVYLTSDNKVELEYVEEFIKLYEEYLKIYIDTVLKAKLFKSNKFDEAIKKAVKNISNYLKISKKTLNNNDLKENRNNLFDLEEESEQKNILDEYIINGKIIKLCDIVEFEELLKNSNLDVMLQQEYMRQMLNLHQEIKREETNKQKELLINMIFKETEIDLINKAKISNNIIATQIVKDINAILELLIDCPEEEKEDLVIESKEYIESLKEILKGKMNIEVPRVIYYKKNDMPLIYKNIMDNKNIQKNNYKNVLASLNRIINGNLVGDRVVEGKIPFYTWAKGNEYKIFYTKIKDVTIIIACYKKDIAYDNIKKILNSKEFSDYYEDIKRYIENEEKINEQIYTDLLTSELTQKAMVRTRVKN